MNTQLGLLALFWILYGMLHSVLASLALKTWVAAHRPDFMPWYRLTFNLVALLALLPGLYLTFITDTPFLWQWQGAGKWLSWAVSLLAMGAFLYSLKFYDGLEFLGLRQIRDNARTVEDQEGFRISPLHRYVRHPWYFLGMLILWMRDMTPELLLTSIAVTLYFAFGSQLEERKLMRYHGAAYSEYRKRVPGLIPLPWKHLTRDEAEALVQRGA